MMSLLLKHGSGWFALSTTMHSKNGAHTAKWSCVEIINGHVLQSRYLGATSPKAMA